MTAMEMQAEALSALAILVPLMAFIYSLHRDQRRRFEALEQRIAALEQRMDQRFAGVDQRFAGVDQRFDSLEQRMDQRFDAVHGRMDALVQSQIKLVNR